MQASTFLCKNGAVCTWDRTTEDYSCGVGTLGPTVPATRHLNLTQAQAGPPNLDCTKSTSTMADHWECAGGLLCELEEDEIWICRGAALDSDKSNVAK